MSESTSRTIAVTGATGFVGRHLVRELLSRGHHVRALARSADKAKKVLPTNDRLTVVQGEALDGTSLDKLVHGTDAAINLIGIIREAGKGQTFERMHVDTTRALLNACHDAGVTRYIQMSALGVTDTARTPYAKTKFRAESAVRASGLDWTIFRPSLVHGVDGEFVGMVRDWCKGRAAPWFFLPYFVRVELGENNIPRPVAPTVAPVHVDDVAKAFADALDQPESIGEVYMLSGPERITWPDLLKTFRDNIPLANTSLRPIGLPGELGAVKAHAMSALGMGNLLPFDAGMAIMGQQDSFASNAKVERHLGFDPRPFTPAVKEYASNL